MCRVALNINYDTREASFKVSIAVITPVRPIGNWYSREIRNSEVTEFLFRSFKS